MERGGPGTRPFRPNGCDVAASPAEKGDDHEVPGLQPEHT
jgi:hypothetical protein